ncbi:MAG: hypothetical protein QXW82_01255 [Candidatus Bathyarchaeia archaeon]
MPVVMVDVNAGVFRKVLEKIKWSLDKLVEKGSISRENASKALHEREDVR